ASRADTVDLSLHTYRTDDISRSQRKAEQTNEAGRIGGVITSDVERGQIFGVQRVRRFARDDRGVAFVKLQRDVAGDVGRDVVDERVKCFLQRREPLPEVHQLRVTDRDALLL